MDARADPSGHEQPAIEPARRLRGRQGSVAERIISEALSWPGVYRAKGEFGIESCCASADASSATSTATRSQTCRLLPSCEINSSKTTRRSTHQSRHDSDWVTVPLETEEGVQQALALLRANYEREQAKTNCPSATIQT